MSLLPDGLRDSLGLFLVPGVSPTVKAFNSPRGSTLVWGHGSQPDLVAHVQAKPHRVEKALVAEPLHKVETNKRLQGRDRM